MTELSKEIADANNAELSGKRQIVDYIESHMGERGYTSVEVDDQRPWGAFIKFDNDQAEAFVTDFFPGLDIADARLGAENVELSPKILIVAPSQRLSWQYHNRRAERWSFLTDGRCERSMTDDEGEVLDLSAGDSIQFSPSERHRLVGLPDSYTLVAEIWQHTDPVHHSDEDDIIRLADDYSR